MALILVYVTHASKEDAKKLASHLLEKRLIACANLFPINSIYRWKGKVEDAEEFVSLLKARPENWEALKKEILSVHPYETPCIIKLDAEANHGFDGWANAESG